MQCVSSNAFVWCISSFCVDSCLNPFRSTTCESSGVSVWEGSFCHCQLITTFVSAQNQTENMRAVFLRLETKRLNVDVKLPENKDGAQCLENANMSFAILVKHLPHRQVKLLSGHVKPCIKEWTNERHFH